MCLWQNTRYTPALQAALITSLLPGPIQVLVLTFKALHGTDWVILGTTSPQFHLLVPLAQTESMLWVSASRELHLAGLRQ